MPALESVALRVLTSQRFPQTYAQLWKQIATAAEKLPETNSMRWFWLAKAAKEANDSDREFEFLEKTIRTQPYNVSIRQRYAILLANRGEFQMAINELDRCLQSSPEDKSLQQLKKQIVELSLKTGVP
jgi:tetratricopeptide (TPR) repeat protein